jgi:hypothetical protein
MYFLFFSFIEDLLSQLNLPSFNYQFTPKIYFNFNPNNFFINNLFLN